MSNSEIKKIIEENPISLPVKIAAELMDKTEMFIRCGLRCTPPRFDFGTGVLMEGGQWSYFISTTKFLNFIGININDVMKPV